MAECVLSLIVAETVQAEGGVQVARVAWLQDLSALCREFGILLIVDDIQVGCGRPRGHEEIGGACSISAWGVAASNTMRDERAKPIGCCSH